jgi:hypothetical protein
MMDFDDARQGDHRRNPTLAEVDEIWLRTWVDSGYIDASTYEQEMDRRRFKLALKRRKENTIAALRRHGSVRLVLPQEPTVPRIEQPPKDEVGSTHRG